MINLEVRSKATGNR